MTTDFSPLCQSEDLPPTAYHPDPLYLGGGTLGPSPRSSFDATSASLHPRGLQPNYDNRFPHAFGPPPAFDAGPGVDRSRNSSYSDYSPHTPHDGTSRRQSSAYFPNVIAPVPYINQLDNSPTMGPVVSRMHMQLNMNDGLGQYPSIPEHEDGDYFAGPDFHKQHYPSYHDHVEPYAHPDLHSYPHTTGISPQTVSALPQNYPYQGSNSPRSGGEQEFVHHYEPRNSPLSAPLVTRDDTVKLEDREALAMQGRMQSLEREPSPTTVGDSGLPVQ